MKTLYNHAFSDRFGMKYSLLLAGLCQRLMWAFATIALLVGVYFWATS